MLEIADEIRRLAGVAQAPESRRALEELALHYIAEAAGLNAGEAAATASLEHAAAVCTDYGANRTVRKSPPVLHGP